MTDELEYDPDTDYYAILGVEDDAAPPAIRKAYHKLTLIYHPDKQPAKTRSKG